MRRTVTVALAGADLEGRGSREQGQECLVHCEEMVSDVIGVFPESGRESAEQSQRTSGARPG